MKESQNTKKLCITSYHDLSACIFRPVCLIAIAESDVACIHPTPPKLRIPF